MVASIVHVLPSHMQAVWRCWINQCQHYWHISVCDACTAGSPAWCLHCWQSCLVEDTTGLWTLPTHSLLVLPPSALCLQVPSLGWRKRDVNGNLGSYSWLTYSQVRATPALCACVCA